MSKTAVGLFENSGLVDGVVRDLTAEGFLEKDIRVYRRADRDARQRSHEHSTH